MKTIQATVDFRSFVLGVSNHTQEPNYWSWTVYLGPVFVLIHILKPRRLRKKWAYPNTPF